MSKLSVRAKIYAIKDGATAIKGFANVEIGGFMFINSVTVTNTLDHPDKLEVYPPSYRLRNGSYKPQIEFAHAGQNKLWAAFRQACLSAYKHYSDTKRLHEYGATCEVEIDSLLELTKDGPLTAINTVFGTCEEVAVNDIPDDFDFDKELGKLGY